MLSNSIKKPLNQQIKGITYLVLYNIYWMDRRCTAHDTSI